MSYETLGYDVSDGVATITLNRPEALNAFSPIQIAELQEVWQRLRFDDSVRAAIVTGAGDKAFSVGIDLNHTYPQPHGVTVIDDPMLRIGPKSNDLWKPVIAAVNGMACGGAFYLLGEVEMILAAESATFFDPHVTHGMPAVYEPMFMLQRMPLGEVMRMSLLGRAERMSAARAHQIGLVQEVAPAGELLERARWVAETIAALPDPRAVEVTVRAVWTAQHLSLPQALAQAAPLVNLISTGTEVGENANRLRHTKVEPRLR